MRLSPGQEAAHDVMLQRLRDGERLTKLSGYAGTGKTTLGRTFVERHHDEFEFIGACPTGKASARQREAAGMPSSTIHRLLWKGVKGVDEDGNLLFGTVDKDHLAEQIGTGLRGRKRTVLWIDEGSMIDLDLARKIMKSVPEPIRIIVSGDPFQLQPVKGIRGFDLDRPDAMLTEVHRQALGSPVIRLATWTRTEQRIPTGADFKRFGIPYFAAPIPAICEAVARRKGDDSAVVVHTHLARQIINRGVRHYLDLPPREAGPAPGELLMIRRNCKHLGIFNGSMARVVSSKLFRDELLNFGYYLVQFEGIDGVAWLPEPSWVEDRKLTFDESDVVFHEIRTHKGFEAGRSIIEAAPGYAATCHAFQGSQFDRVFIVDEGSRDIHWWYTAITRAVEHLVCGLIKGWRQIKQQELDKAAAALAAKHAESGLA